jgi:serine protease Do
VGKTVAIEVIRDKKDLSLNIMVTEMPAGKVTSSGEAVPEENLGISVDNITPELRNEFKIRDRSGVVITDVSPNSPASDAGLQAGDVIKEVNRTPVDNTGEYSSAMKKAGKNRPVLFLIRRGGQTFYVTIQVS